MRSKAVFVASILGMALVSGGWLMQQGAAFTGTTREYDRSRLFDQVLQHVAGRYVDSLAVTDLYGRATRGVLRELHDPYSVYLSSERLARLTENTTGRYQGVGVELDVRDGWITVVTPLPGTPAEQAGVQGGDRIVAIDGKRTEGWAPEEALRALRGRPGTVVTFIVERPGVDEPVPFRLTRREIQFHPVQNALMLRDGVGYVDLAVFSEESARELRQAIDSLRRVGARALIVDVRGNPGGLLEQGVAVTDLFLDRGMKIVEMRGRTRDANQTFVDDAPQPYPSMPLAVLVDSASASASEILAGALQDHDRAIVIGSTTYGKGSAQSVLPLEDGGAVKLTTALWYTPSGRSITRPHIIRSDDEEDEQSSFVMDSGGARAKYRTGGGRTVYGGGGVTPDVVIPTDTPTTHERAFENALGKRVADFRQVVLAYARSLRGRPGVTTPTFPVTPQMRDELFQALRERGVAVERSVYDAAWPAISELLGNEAARALFGRRGESQRRLAADEAVARAVALVAGASTQRDVFRRAERKS